MAPNPVQTLFEVPSLMSPAAQSSPSRGTGSGCVSPARIFSQSKTAKELSQELIGPRSHLSRSVTPSRISRLPRLGRSVVSSVAAAALQVIPSPLPPFALKCLQFARTGPLWPALVEARDGVELSVEDLIRDAKDILAIISNDSAPDIASLRCTDPILIRILWLYLPLLGWVLARLRKHTAKGKHSRPLVVGISAPQGCGKTTLVTTLEKLLAKHGRKCVAVSYDDFYLTGREQDDMARATEGNPLLQQRGNAGTHDLALITETFKDLCDWTRKGPISIPHYDKSARHGRGDRASLETWSKVDAPVDVVLLEGWMAGFKPLTSEAPVLQDHEGLLLVNKLLRQYDVVDNLIDVWVVMRVQSPNVVFNWRLQAEHEMKAQGKPGMSDIQVKEFCQMYMPAYAAYLPELYSNVLGSGVGGKPTISCMLDVDRRPIFP